jgi:hypothetical protein
MHEMKDEVILRIFGMRITKIRVVDAQIWRKEFQGPICNF